MSKVYITGHTSGLGLALHRLFASQEHEVISMSRSNGYDLEHDVDQFVRDDFDVYVNNAYSGFGQVDLLYKLFEKNQHRTCSIVNIGSVSADGNKDYANQYAVHKSSLEKACTQLQLIDSECQVIHVKLGRMNTPMTEHRTMYPRMHPAYVARSIDWILKQPGDILVKNLTLDVMHSNRIIDE